MEAAHLRHRRLDPPPHPLLVASLAPRFRLGSLTPPGAASGWRSRSARLWQRWHSSAGRQAALRRLGLPAKRAKFGASSSGAWAPHSTYSGGLGQAHSAGSGQAPLRALPGGRACGDERSPQQRHAEKMEVRTTITTREIDLPVFQPPDAENRMSGGVGALTGATPSGRPDPGASRSRPSSAAAQKVRSKK